MSDLFNYFFNYYFFLSITNLTDTVMMHSNNIHMLSPSLNQKLLALTQLLRDFYEANERSLKSPADGHKFKD